MRPAGPSNSTLWTLFISQECHRPGKPRFPLQTYATFNEAGRHEARLPGSFYSLNKMSTQLGTAGMRTLKSHSGNHFSLRVWASKTGSSGKNSSGVFRSAGVKSLTENRPLNRRIDQ